jgi:hypothetical protein
VIAPGYRREIEFDDYYRFHDRAGITRIVGNMGYAIEQTPLSYEAVVTLRDPIGDDQTYETRYRLDLRDLMPYTMIDAPSEGETASR